MLRHFVYIGLVCSMLFSCKSKQPDGSAIPDMQPYFLQRLHAADSSISLDSFRFLKFDTLHEKWTLNRQRYPYLRDFGKINFELDSIAKLGITTPEIKKTTAYLQEEKKYLAMQIDSINNLLLKADTIKPIGYFMRYKCSVKKKDGTVFTDTIKFSLDTGMHVIEWDRNIEKTIDSLIAGKHTR